MIEREALRRRGRPVGELLREWRKRRRYSQLALALDAGTSARHLSFIETGRAVPSREMLHRLAERLDIPLRNRNALFLAAGYAPVYEERELDDVALDSVRRAAGLMLKSLEPCPALVVDRHWTLVEANRTLRLLLAGVADELLQPPVNALRVSLHPRGLGSRIANFAEWRAHVLRRLERDAEDTGDPVLLSLRRELEGYPVPSSANDEANADVRPGEAGEAPAVAVPLRLHAGGGVLSLISTTTVFGTAVDPAAAELVIESFLPADEDTARALERLGAGAMADGDERGKEPAAP